MNKVTYFSLFINLGKYGCTAFPSISFPSSSAFVLNSFSALQKNASIAHERALLVENITEVIKIANFSSGKLAFQFFVCLFVFKEENK